MPDMQLKCPECGQQFPLSAAVQEAAATRFALLMGELPPLVARRWPAYLRLFRPRGGALPWARMEALSRDLVEAITQQTLDYKGTTWRIPHATWAEGLDTVDAMPDKRLPLTSHNLLLGILANKASAAGDRGAQAREATSTRGEPPAELRVTPAHNHHTIPPERRASAGIAMRSVREILAHATPKHPE